MGDPHRFAAGQQHGPAATDGTGMLADLVVLWGVRVEVVLPIEHGRRSHVRPQSEREGDGKIQGFLVQRWERAWQAEADRAHGLVGGNVNLPYGTSAEDIRSCTQGHEDLKSDEESSLWPR